MTTATDLDRLGVIEQKLDGLTDRVTFLAQVVEEQELRRRSWEDLRVDIAPIADQAMELVTRELDDIKDFVEPADLLRVAKRLLRDLPQIEAMLDQVQSVSALAGDIVPLGSSTVLAAMSKLDEFERKGYFTFVKGLYEVADRIVTSFDEDDLNQLGDNVVLILNTVKEMTQPEVMQLLQRTAQEVRTAETEELGLMRLAWRMRNPAVRRGMSRVLKVLESLADMTPETLAEAQLNNETAADDQGRS
ncbi:hypothetical protein HQ535_01465 [bacterium]|nr:hypothetical protein [bacterium]